MPWDAHAARQLPLCAGSQKACAGIQSKEREGCTGIQEAYTHLKEAPRNQLHVSGCQSGLSDEHCRYIQLCALAKQALQLHQPGGHCPDLHTVPGCTSALTCQVCNRAEGSSDDRRSTDAYTKTQNPHRPEPRPLVSPEAMLCQLQAGLAGVKDQQRFSSLPLHTITI